MRCRAGTRPKSAALCAAGTPVSLVPRASGHGPGRRPVGAGGFSLIEAVVSLTILASGVIGLMGTFSLCMRAAGASLRLADAVAVAERRLAYAAGTPSGQLAEASGKEGSFTWRMTVEDMPHDLVRASVVVRWLDRGWAREYSLSRVVAPVREEEQQAGAAAGAISSGRGPWAGT